MAGSSTFLFQLYHFVGNDIIEKGKHYFEIRNQEDIMKRTGLRLAWAGSSCLASITKKNWLMAQQG